MMSDSKKKVLGAASVCAAVLACGVAFVSPSAAFAAQPLDESPVTWRSDDTSYQAQRFSDGSISVTFSGPDSGDGASVNGSITAWSAKPADVSSPSTISWQEGVAGETKTTVLTFGSDNESGRPQGAIVTIERDGNSGARAATLLRSSIAEWR